MEDFRWLYCSSTFSSIHMAVKTDTPRPQHHNQSPAHFVHVSAHIHRDGTLITILQLPSCLFYFFQILCPQFCISDSNKLIFFSFSRIWPSELIFPDISISTEFTFQSHNTTERSWDPHRTTSICTNSQWTEA